MSIRKETYGNMPDGREIRRFILENGNGIKVGLIEYGAIVDSIIAPDKHGNEKDIALGFDNLEDWIQKNDPHFGATIGRVANRIANGHFSLEGIDYQLSINNGPHCLHGGIEGFDRKVWEGRENEDSDTPTVCFHRVSPDGEENFPGNLDCSIHFSLTADNRLVIDYTAESDQTTICNLTNHTYFNLAGHDGGDIGDHFVQIFADRYTPNDENQLPTGEIVNLAGGSLDLRQGVELNSALDRVGGYDHNYVLEGDRSPDAVIARVEHPPSGRLLEVSTSEPGVQFYTANFLDGVSGKSGAVYGKQHAFCLEAQRFPDAINHENFPNVVLRPGEAYRQTTTYKFGLTHP